MAKKRAEGVKNLTPFKGLGQPGSRMDPNRPRTHQKACKFPTPIALKTNIGARRAPNAAPDQPRPRHTAPDSAPDLRGIRSYHYQSSLGTGVIWSSAVRWQAVELWKCWVPAFTQAYFGSLLGLRSSCANYISPLHRCTQHFVL